MNKTIKSVFKTIFLFGFFMLASCNSGKFVDHITFGNENTIYIEENGFTFNDYTINVFYTDGTSRSIPLTSDMIPATEQTKLHKIGTWDVTIDYLGRTTSFNVVVSRGTIEDFFTLENQTFTYDGLAHTFRIDQDLPAGLTVSYPNGYSFTEVGTHEFKVVVKGEGYETIEQSCIIKIEKADYDVANSGRVFLDNQKFVYDGQPKMVEVSNLPEDLQVSYTKYKINEDESKEEVEKAIDAGSYEVIAHYSCLDKNNYNSAIPDEKVTFTISKMPIVLSNDLFTSKEVTYSGEPYSVDLIDKSTLPSWVDVSYKIYKVVNGNETLVEKAIDAGFYKFVADFEVKNPNYSELPSKVAYLTIKQQEINLDNVQVKSLEVDYDGTGHYLTDVINVPDNVTYMFSNNEPKVKAGTYEVSVLFTPVDETNYYVSKRQENAWIIINVINETVDFSSSDIIFDGNDWLTVTGDYDDYDIYVILYDYYDHEFYIDKAYEGVTYFFVAYIFYKDEEKNDSIDVSNVTGYWTAE